MFHRWPLTTAAASVLALLWATSSASAAKPPAGPAIDARLLHKLTLQEKGVSLTDFCAHLQAQTGVEVRAARSVADEKVTVFVKEQPARNVMRAVARLFGYFWSRSGPEGEYRYTLEQDLKSQLAEEELRNRDLNAALLALDAQMQKFRPYLDTSMGDLKKQWEQVSEGERRLFWSQPWKSDKRQLWTLANGGGWVGMQLYHRLTPGDRVALQAGQELVFSTDDPNPDRRLPAEWSRPTLLSWQGRADPDGHQIPSGTWIGGHFTLLTETPGIKLAEVRLRLNRSELGELSLVETLRAGYSDAGKEVSVSTPNRELANGRSPSTANPDNALQNAALRGRPPFDQVISLHPVPSCPVDKKRQPGDGDPHFADVPLLLEPHIISADMWEAVHKETGLPVVADFFTHLYPAAKATVERRPLFDGLCSVCNDLGIRWRKDGDFLLGRSAGYLWDKLKEVPNRYLHRWAQDRDTNGGLPLADFLEMASMTDRQLDSQPVAMGIEMYWGLPEWGWLRGFGLINELRQQARCLALLTPDQQRRALEPVGLPFRDLTPAQQQAVMQRQYAIEAEKSQEVGGGGPSLMRPEGFVDASIIATYFPAGWYAALVPGPPEFGDAPAWVIGGRTAAEAVAAARQRFPRSGQPQVRRTRAGYFNASVMLVYHR